jgi:succinylglutamate desuccinylase
MPGLADARSLLARARGDLPPMIEVVERRAITPDDAFRMEPGFANIQRTPGGTLLAHDARSEIRAPFDGLVLLPLYQAQGNDGFFYGRALTPRTS